MERYGTGVWLLSPTSWHWSTREGRQGNGDQFATICRNTDCRAETPPLPQSHPSIGIHEITSAWRGRLGNPGDRGPMMLDQRWTKRLALCLADRARQVHGPCVEVQPRRSWATRVIMTGGLAPRRARSGGGAHAGTSVAWLAAQNPRWPGAGGLGSRAGARSPGADAIPTNRVRPADPPQRFGGRCGSRASPDATGTSPTPSAPDDGPGDRKTNGSAPRQSRREAEPQRRLPGGAAALSRHTGVSRDQPQGERRVQRREPDGFPLGGAWRSQAPTVKGPKSVVQTRSWPRGVASTGGRRSRRPAGTGHRPVPRPATRGRRSM